MISHRMDCCNTTECEALQVLLWSSFMRSSTFAGLLATALVGRKATRDRGRIE